MLSVFKVVVSALMIGGINEIARRSPKIGGLFAAMPIISMLSILWLRVDNRSNDQIADFLVGVIWGLAPTTALLLAEVVALRRGVPLWLAVVIGILIWLGVTFVMRKAAVFRA